MKESKEKKSERALAILNLLKQEYPDSKCSLHYQSTYELLIATILSAQCTDKRVNQVTPGLFKKYPSIEEFAHSDLQELSKDIHSCGYHNQKSRSIQGATLTILNEFDGEVPNSLDDLVSLPGVGRKTANCVLGECFNVPSMVIDTHMVRIMNLLELTHSKDPKKIELGLMDIFPNEEWVKLTHMIIDHGRAICIARRPQCQNCILTHVCPSSLME
ncbi:MAG: endonuclease III [Candidatus Marinimicrobia bacterium]|nr:endonuclease III [Candidatus Neomarinimicrobiota bacterium]MBT3938033.1 endonuclease III [Candidatus Neomarinimicrobiota bacterium]MBT3961555.1 endonuclease III [Candidatus Neomarinimicrobiota bacterium]MBT4382057.1 endonuclease III [Candidatus Neomarinimicrobiota bacterium]MBT4636088.1 endonuclease III [Candidatus Neomarinimicrobiota bacterium]